MNLKVHRDIRGEVESPIMLAGWPGMGSVGVGAINYLPKPADTDEILAAFAKDKLEDVTPPQKDIETPSLGRVEWEHINRVLADCGGNISAAAKRLNIHRRTLQRKLLKYPPFQ